MKELLMLYISFAKVGVTTFGGGYAMLPILEAEIVDKRNWATREELTNYYAIGQCTPGIIAVNTATFIGAKRKGVVGGISATLGMITPCLIIICIIAAFLDNFAELAIVQSAFSAIRVTVAALIIFASVKLFKTNVKDAQGVVLAVCGFVCSLLMPTYAIIVGTVIVGLILAFYKVRRQK